MRTKKIVLPAIVCSAVLALSACAGGGTATTTPDAEGPQASRGDIDIWYSNNGSEIEWATAMIEAWNAEHPDEQITGQEIPAGSSSEEVITAAITAGTTPCLVFNNYPAATGQFQRQGGLVNLSEFEDGEEYIVSRTGDIAEQYRSPDGSFYQMPWKSNPVMIFYNKDLFTAAGLDAENPALSTYDEFLDTARRLVSSGAAEFAIHPSPTSEFFQPGFDFIPLFAAATEGQQIVENGTATFNNEAGLEVADFWSTIYAEGLAGKEPPQSDLFVDGKAAMAIVGPWAIGYYGASIANWGAVPVPTADGLPADQVYTYSDSKSIGMYSNCENQATAWDVLKFATGEEQDGQLLEIAGQMPMREDLSGTYPEYFEANPAYLQFGDAASRTVENPSYIETIAIMQALRDAYTSAVIAGDEDVKDAFDTAATEANELAAEG
ncbi:extracellular solute-binding protein [Microbacterium sp. ABRD28]|uniref:extracellular solute-binding protein n=1 Tax=Microbacterium sp. ABRD28 TaxID=2268461 RepID=UPI000F54CA84|nr:extracellular solute-binding protein [Microbacterium sp. ABRD28]AZC12991.1 extracellular solute-binding protein [Microbacterium sp. ABRD28]